MNQASITLQNVSLDYPLYGVSSKDLRNKFLTAATGGLLKIAGNNMTEVCALTDVSFTATIGDRIGISGHNGAGKTSLLRVLAGIIAPTTGQVEIKGRVLPLLNISVGAYPDLTGREIIRLRLRLDGYTPKEVTVLEEEIIDFAELGQGFSRLPIRTYSTGMLARLLFSIVTLQRPDILLIDEWLSVADASFVAKAEQRMHDLVGSAGIVVMASHNMDLLNRWCNRVYQLEHGRMTLLDQPAS